MIDVKAIAGPLPSPHPGQSPIQAVTQPIEEKADNHQHQAGAAVARVPVTEAGANRAANPKNVR